MNFLISSAFATTIEKWQSLSYFLVVLLIIKVTYWQLSSIDLHFLPSNLIWNSQSWSLTYLSKLRMQTTLFCVEMISEANKVWHINLVNIFLGIRYGRQCFELCFQNQWFGNESITPGSCSEIEIEFVRQIINFVLVSHLTWILAVYLI